MNAQNNLARTTREVNTAVGGGRVKYDVTVPAGTLCKRLGAIWVVQNLSWLPKTDGAYHDAYYRGIQIAEADLDIGGEE